MPKAKTRRPAKNTLSKTQKKAVDKEIDSRIMSYAERKYFDVNINAQPGTYDNPVVWSLNGTAQGDADTNRNGDSITMTSLLFRGWISLASDQAVASRLIIVNFKAGDIDPSGSSAVTYLLRNILQGGAPDARTFLDHYLHDNRNRFQVLYDRTFGVQDAMGVGNSNARIHFQKAISLKKKETQYSSSSSVMTKNALYAFWFSNQTLASGLSPVLDLHCRLNYIDV